jgi:hypothetical protein
MLTKTMKWVSVVALLLALVGRPSAGYQTVLEFVVCLSGLLVLAQAVRTGRYIWAVGFMAIAVLFNPVLPVVLSRKITLGLGWVSLATFLVSLAALQGRPILSIPSITDRTPGSESL